MPVTPSAPGIYAVTLDHDEPVSVNADRPHLAEKSVFVDLLNCKFGRAENLARREKEYRRTFGSEHMTFSVVAVTPNHRAVEAEVMRRLDQYRLRGGTGRATEWLEGIEPSKVIEVIKDVASIVGLMSHTDSSNAAESKRTTDTPRPAPPPAAQPTAVVTSDEIVEALTYLQRSGMTLDQLRDIHHSSARRETFAAARQYFTRVKELRERNLSYGCRLRFLSEQHSKSSGDFSALVRDALLRYPK